MIFETNRGVMNGIELVDELMFINYAANRDAFPHISPERWKGHVDAETVDALESRYQSEKAAREQAA